MRDVSVSLDEPPEVVNAGFAIHGLNSLDDRFRLPDLWQLHLYEYEADLEVNGSSHRIKPGRISLIPADADVYYRYRGRSEHLYVHLRPSGRGRAHPLPLIQDAGASASAIAAQLRQAIAAAPDSPAEASALVWAVMWGMVRLRPTEIGDERHPAAAAALAFIEQRLPQPITVAQVAAAAGVSHNHLTRLVRQATGTTVVAYIRRRRLARAEHLLLESTLSIPAIAAMVGIADLQAFNKACRRELGASPRAVREAARY